MYLSRLRGFYAKEAKQIALSYGYTVRTACHWWVQSWSIF